MSTSCILCIHEEQGTSECTPRGGRIIRMPNVRQYTVDGIYLIYYRGNVALTTSCSVVFKAAATAAAAVAAPLCIRHLNCYVHILRVSP